MRSKCCNSQTRIGYYNIKERPDIHSNILSNTDNVYAVVGTYCNKCNKLCDYTDEKNNEYFTNGIRKIKK